MLFDLKSSFNIARGIFGPTPHPVYVQFYITARCNLTCKQCNIIYANANVREASVAEIEQIADNLKKVGTAIVLLTGGEPFIRKDLPDIVRAFTKRGIHVRTQTNGLASFDALSEVASAGARDISISLDSLHESKQDFLNGSHDKSWMRAIRTISDVTKAYPKNNSFAALGTVLSPQNILEIPNIIRFATAIGWYVSLVPAHIADPSQVFNFRSYDREMLFSPDLYQLVDEVLAECLALKKQGYQLYDSAEYLYNIKLLIRGQQVRWRRRNQDRCDSPDLYFAIRPNGDLQVCCDHVLADSYPVWHSDFPRWFKNGELRRAVHPITSACSGCMYGSYPEISITAHFPLTLLERMGVFWKTRHPKPWPLEVDQILEIINDINSRYPIDDSPWIKRLEAVQKQSQASTLFQINTSSKRRAHECA
jgi:MoaA/NifB/PqqE/SkfB family radical SAM enzyme